MCRIFAYVGNSERELNGLYMKLRDAAAHDEMAERLNVGFTQHGDGWGYAIAEEGGALHHYRTSLPIYKDVNRIPALKGSFSAIFHVRKASDGSTIRPMFSHPFAEEDENSHTFFAHNGTLDKDALADELGFKGTTTDSEMAAKLFARDGERCMKTLEKNTKSALNLLIMKIDRRNGRTSIFYKNYYAKRGRDEFYDLHFQKLRHGRTVYSSTFNLLGMNGKKVRYGTLSRL